MCCVWLLECSGRLLGAPSHFQHVIARMVARMFLMVARMSLGGC